MVEAPPSGILDHTRAWETDSALGKWLFEKYCVDSVVHSNNSDTVYRATTKEGHKVILKAVEARLHSHHELARLENEYSIIQQLETNPYVPHPVAFARDNSMVAIVWEDDSNFITISQYLERYHRFSIEQFLRVALQIADALHQVHSKGIIHRDLSGANLLIHPSTLEIKLIDFNGSAFWREFVAHNLCLTYHYISPEHTGKFCKQIDFRSDLYSLGVVFH